jgi:hypothetical protein
MKTKPTSSVCATQFLRLFLTQRDAVRGSRFSVGVLEAVREFTFERRLSINRATNPVLKKPSFDQSTLQVCRFGQTHPCCHINGDERHDGENSSTLATRDGRWRVGFGIQIRPKTMPRDARNSFDGEHSLGRDNFTSDPTGYGALCTQTQEPSQCGLASNCLASLQQRSERRIFCRIGHAPD